MNDNKQKLLQKEIAFYKDLLKKHESLSKNDTKLHSTKQLHNSNRKQQSLPVYKSEKKPSLVTNMTISHSQISSTNILCHNKRTVLYNDSIKVEKSSQNIGSALFTEDKVVNKTQTPVILDKKHSVNNFISNTSVKPVASESKDLLKEIEFLTTLLKSANEKPVVTKSITTAVANNKTINTRYKKCDIFQQQKKSKLDIHTPTVNLPHNYLKHNLNIDSNKAVNNFSVTHLSKSTSFNKYSLKRFDVKQNMSSTTSDTFNLENKNAKLFTLYEYNSYSQSLPSTAFPDCRKIKDQNNFNSFKKVSAMPKVMTQEKQILDKRLDLTKSPTKYKIVNKQPSSTSKANTPSIPRSKSALTVKVKSPLFSKSTTRHRTVYSKVNKKILSPLMKHSKNKFVYCKNSPINQKAKKVNMIYKVINKANTPKSNKTLNQDSKSNKNTVLDSSDSFIELLDDTDIDILEQRLLAVSTSLTATPNTIVKRPGNPSSNYNKSCVKRTPKCKVLTSKYKVVNKNVTNKINSKLALKKTPTKKLKVLSSKYKVVNKNQSKPKNFLLKNKENTPIRNSVKKICRKVVLTKFSIVNKHSPVNMTSRYVKSSPILIKRLYKSKSTIINKNDSHTGHSAKLIKSKYFGLNKRRSSSFQKYTGYQKLQKFKGPYRTSNMHLKLNHYQKCMEHSKRRISKNINYISNRFYQKNNSNIFKQKRNKAYAHSPVLSIRGTRYSMSSSGKTLQRLPMKGQTSTNITPKRMIAGKPFSRHSNVRRVVNSPLSVHIASRVLNRSINRVLSASAKKSLTKVNTYCMFYNRFGRCNRGVKCTYIHDPSKIAVCTRFLRGTCKTEGCPFSHEVAPGKMAICSFFLVGACEKENCPYRHEPLSSNAVLCKAFVQGYCPNGNKCKNAHILICPKFILGECEKGSSCAYPHPPQRAKKNVPKDTAVVDTQSTEKKEDVLLERVARYFIPQQGNTTTCIDPYEKRDAIHVVMPKVRKLEEQPAFIPLSDAPATTTSKEQNKNL